MISLIFSDQNAKSGVTTLERRLRRYYMSTRDFKNGIPFSSHGLLKTFSFKMEIQTPDLSLFHHRSDLQLRFNDVDVLGHVNNTVYFSFYDTGKALYFSDVQGWPVDWRNVDRVIANVNCAYIAPIHFGDDMEVLTRCSSIGNKSFTLQQVLREKRSGQIKSVCQTVMVAIDPVTQRAVELTPEIRKAFADYEGHEF